MNKFFYFAVSSILLLGGCTKSEVIEMSQHKAMNFNTFIDKSSKASVVDQSNIASATIYAYVHSGKWVDRSETPKKFMTNITLSISKDGSASTKSTYYWPNDENVTFFAYAPQSASISVKEVVDSGDFTMAYTTTASVSDQKDLVYSKVADTNQQNNGSQGVDLSFKHILSRVSFSAINGAGATVKVTSLQVNYKKIASMGSYYNDAWTHNGYFDAEDSSGEILAKGAEIEVVSTDINNATPLSGADSYLMLIPQDQKLLSDNSVWSVDVTYLVTNEGSSVELTSKVELPKVNLEQGKAYNFVLNISPAGSDPDNPSDVVVTFNKVAIDGWDEEIVDTSK